MKPFSDLIAIEDLDARDVMLFLGPFTKVDYQCMCMSNNDGDGIWRGKLVGFVSVGATIKTLLPIVEKPDGTQLMTMGFVLPLWEEMFAFLSTQDNEAHKRFWAMADLVNGHSGLNKIETKDTT